MSQRLNHQSCQEFHSGNPTSSHLTTEVSQFQTVYNRNESLNFEKNAQCFNFSFLETHPDFFVSISTNCPSILRFKPVFRNLLAKIRSCEVHRCLGVQNFEMRKKKIRKFNTYH